MNEKKKDPGVVLALKTQSPEKTFELGLEVGRLVEPSTVIGLNGTLGAGKTKLTQGIVGAILDSPEAVVVSPTYTLCIPYSGRVELLHLDAYRIAEDEEVFELGLDEAVDDGAVLIVEWVAKIADLLPKLDVVFEFQTAPEPSSLSERQVAIHALTQQGQGLVSQLAEKLGESLV